MFLYENNGDFIDVYKLEPKLEDITNYKKIEMGKISEADRIWKAVTNDYNLKVLGKNKYLISASELEFSKRDEKGVQLFHYFFRKHSSELNNDFLENYYNDKEFNLSFCKIDSYSNEDYIILLNSSYSFVNCCLYVMDGIIRISESLYLLEALLQKKFDLIGEKDITEQLKLFDIVHYGRINTVVLQNICEYGLLSDSFESIMNRIHDNKNLLGRVRMLAK